MAEDFFKRLFIGQQELKMITVDFSHPHFDPPASSSIEWTVPLPKPMVQIEIDGRSVEYLDFVNGMLRDIAATLGVPAHMREETAADAGAIMGLPVLMFTPNFRRVILPSKNRSARQFKKLMQRRGGKLRFCSPWFRRFAETPFVEFMRVRDAKRMLRKIVKNKLTAALSTGPVTPERVKRALGVSPDFFDPSRDDPDTRAYNFPWPPETNNGD